MNVLEDMKDQEITSDNLLPKKDDSVKKVLAFDGDHRYGDYENAESYGRGRGRGRNNSNNDGRGRQGGYGRGRGYRDNNDGIGGNDGNKGYVHEVDKCKLCDGGKYCITAWQGLGCVEIYQLKTIEERKNWLQAHKLCFKCGSKYF